MKRSNKLTVFLALQSLLLSPALADGEQLSYPQVATGQVKTYNNDGVEVTGVKVGDKFYGQDAHYLKGAPMSYKDNGDGTVTDLNTGLMWQIDPPKDGFSWQEASDYCDKLDLGGYDDWRLPSAKELFSISNFNEGWPYLTREFFKLVNDTQVGKDEQYWTSNKYLGSIERGGHNGVFGVNHGTGHIKTYSAGGQGGPQGQGQGGQGAPPQGGAPQGGAPQGGAPQGGAPQGGAPQGGGPQGDHLVPSSTGAAANGAAPQGARPQGARPQGAPQGAGGPQGAPQGEAMDLSKFDKDGDGKLNEEEFKAALAARPQGGQGAPGGQAGGPPPGGQAGGAPRGNPAAKQVRAVRGAAYGINKFVDNGDGTITDQASGLMWAKVDSEKGMDWESALTYAEDSQLAGHSDWRLPNVKELQGIVNYDRAPNSSDPSKEGPAIDPIFQCSDFTNEKGVKDYPYFWTGTSALFRKGTPYVYAWYVAFGRAVSKAGDDSHGAGGVRFDTKHKDGPAGEDDGRVFNYVRIVRDVK